MDILNKKRFIDSIKGNSQSQKVILNASWGCGFKDQWRYRDWNPPFKKIFKKIFFFDTRDIYYIQGKQKMNEEFLKFVEQLKPDYIIYTLSYDEFFPKTLFQIRKISPKTKNICFFGDDGWRYDDHTRYYALFFDYIITSELDNTDYKKDGIKNVSFLNGINPGFFRPLNLKKKYDVSFIGTDIADRAEYIKFLLNNKINVKVFGEHWDKHNIKSRPLGWDEYITIANQSKININFSKGFLASSKNQFKGRVLEIPACNSFMLTEDFPSLKYFFKDYEKIKFNTKQELLQKIKYYLEKEDEREKIANRIYKKIMNDYTWGKLFTNFFKKIDKQEDFHKSLPKTNKKVFILSENDINLPEKNLKENLKENLKDYDYISFQIGKVRYEDYKQYLQIYSLEKSKKQISCCDSIVSSKLIGDYLIFSCKRAFQRIGSKSFHSLLDINQLMVTKGFFLKNFNIFKKFFKGQEINLITKKNTVFVSIPLVKIQKIRKINFLDMKESFRILFLEKLYSLKYKKELYSSSYPYKLFLTGLFEQKFILEYLFNLVFDKKKWHKLKIDKIG